jgi:hypothetical protein
MDAFDLNQAYLALTAKKYGRHPEENILKKVNFKKVVKK